MTARVGAVIAGRSRLVHVESMLLPSGQPGQRSGETTYTSVSV